ncbi:CFEM domain-containing protein [Fusarium acuminatum]|uniref:CFEM domain-containing protein n=1 Tax=Fusarium acuminatum TaxID=5515 RepID=A0ABZ2WZX7_9HYPO
MRVRGLFSQASFEYVCHPVDNDLDADSAATQNWTNTYCNGPVRDKASSLIKLTIILGVFSGTSILLRIGSKIFFLHSDFGLDDLFTILSFCCCVPSIAIIIHGTAIYGLGRDIWTLEFDDITTFTFFFYLLEVLYFPLISLLKMSLLFFYLRIFSVGLAHKLLWGTIIFNALYGIIFVFLAAFQCNPISYFWTKWDGEHEGTCMTIVSIIRLQYLVNFGFSENPTYDETDISIWSTVEIHIGIICVSMPALRVLLIRLFPALGGSSYNTSNYQNYRVQCQNHALVEVPSWGGSISRPEHGGIEL